jgi:hypothetical protein
MKENLLRKEFLRKMQIAFLLVLVVGILTVLGVWVYLTARGLHFVRMADYHVLIPNKATASGCVYSLGKNKYVLVLTDGSSEHYEAYYLDLVQKEIGLPSFDVSKYTPLWHSALVDARVLEGYPMEGVLAADWRADEREVRIRVKGFPRELQQQSHPPFDPEEFSLRVMPLAYKTEIVIRRKTR